MYRIQASLVLLVVVAAALFGIASDASAAPSFVRIADTSDGSIGFANPYSLNDHGDVAFEAYLEGGISEIRFGAGGSTTLVADTRGRFTSFAYPPAINNAGTVSFTASLDAGGNQIWTVGNVSQLVADTTGGFQSLVSGRINNSGVVAFLADLRSGGHEIRKGDGSGSVPVANTVGAFNAFNSGSGINDAGVVSFYADLDGSGQNVWTSDGVSSVLIASADGQTSALAPIAHAVNSLGAVAFVLEVVGGQDELRVGNGGLSSLIATGSGFSSGGPAINDGGVVAFIGAPSTSGTFGIFSTIDLVNPIVFAGMQLDGKTVQRFDFAAALNNANQLAFRVEFSDSSQAIYRADIVAVPEPSTLVLAAMGLAIGLLGWKRRKGH